VSSVPWFAAARGLESGRWGLDSTPLVDLVELVECSEGWIGRTCTPVIGVEVRD